MIKILSLHRLLTQSSKIRSLYKTSLYASTLPLKQRALYSFSTGGGMPRNKQQAWMMQEQKSMSSGPQSDEQTKSYEGVSRVGIFGFAVLLSGLIYIVYNADVKSKQQTDYFEQEIKGLLEEKQKESLVGGDWTLVNSEGQPFSSQMLTGYYYLVYFGYTNCPDMSPNTLFYISTMYRIIRNLPEGAYLKIKIVFISLDPERDTPQAMKEYLKNFSKNIIGVTGSSANDIELKEALKKFRIQTKKVSGIKGMESSNYLIDHGRRVFLMDPQNKYLFHLDLDVSQQQSAKAVLAKIIQNQNRKEKMAEQINPS